MFQNRARFRNGIWLLLLLLVMVVLEQAPTTAQVLVPNPPVLMEWTATGENNCRHWELSFSHDARYILILDGPKLIVFDRETKRRRVVREDPDMKFMWVCPQSGGLFVVCGAQKTRSRYESEGGDARLDYLASIEDWFHWNVSWSLPVYFRRGIRTQFLRQTNQLAIFEQQPGKSRRNLIPNRMRLRLFDVQDENSGLTGTPQPLAEVVAPGLTVGLEASTNGTALYYLEQNGDKMDLSLHRAVVDVGRESLQQQQQVGQFFHRQLMQLPRPSITKDVWLGPRFLGDANNLYHLFGTSHLTGLRFQGDFRAGDFERLRQRMSTDPTFYMDCYKLGALDERLTALAPRMLYSYESQQFMVLGRDEISSGLAIADVVPGDYEYELLTVEYDFGRKNPLVRRIRVWAVKP